MARYVHGDIAAARIQSPRGENTPACSEASFNATCVDVSKTASAVKPNR